MKNTPTTSTDRPPRGTIIDISQTLSPEIAVWPGDTKFSMEWVMRLDSGCSCNVSTLRLSSHTGTHADAPHHFIDGAPTPADVDLLAYIGICRVTTIKSADAVRPSDLDGIDWQKTERILFKTPRSTKETDWRDDFSYVTVEAARILKEKRVRLVGIDTPSIDFMTSKTLETHKVFSSAGIAILENLALGGVADGEYELIAPPLKIKGGCASPVRAVLRVL